MKYAERQQAMYRELLNIGIRFGEQRTLDLVEVALHRMGWGLKRINALLDLLRELDEYYASAWESTMESDVFQERLDNELRDIVKDKQEFIPFEKRYPEVRRLGYDKLPKRQARRKEWARDGS